MSRFRRHKDTAHPAVVKALLGAGCLVVVLEHARWAGGGRKQQTAGAPDLMVTLRGRTVALEVKTPGAKKSRREDPDQEAFRCAASVNGLEWFQVSTTDQALAAVGAAAPPPVRAPRGPQPAYTPPRTQWRKCSTPTCTEQAAPGGLECTGCFLEDAEAKR